MRTYETVRSRYIIFFHKEEMYEEKNAAFIGNGYFDGVIYAWSARC